MCIKYICVHPLYVHAHCIHTWPLHRYIGIAHIYIKMPFIWHIQYHMCLASICLTHACFVWGTFHLGHTIPTEYTSPPAMCHPTCARKWAMQHISHDLVASNRYCGTEAICEQPCIILLVILAHKMRFAPCIGQQTNACSLGILERKADCSLSRHTQFHVSCYAEKAPCIACIYIH